MFRFIKEYDRVLKSTEVKNKLKEYEEFLQNLKKLVGKKTPVDFDDILLLHNNLDIENRLNMTMEPWMSELLKNGTLKNLREYYYELSNYNDKLIRLKTGKFCSQIPGDILTHKNNKFIKTNFAILSS